MTSDVTGPKHFIHTFTRAQLDKITNDFLQKTIEPCEICLKDAGITKEDVSEVLLVGGMTKMPKVQQLVEKIFGKKPNKGINPDEAVAMGAAI